jgi:flagellar motor switch protein FliM
MSDEVYNFRKPGRLDNDLEQRLRAWLQDAAASTTGTATKSLSLSLQVRVQGIEVVRSPECLDRLPAENVAYHLDAAPGDLKTLLVLPRPLGLALVAAALGDRTAGWPADRELTTIEQSLCEYMVQQLLVAALQQTWPTANSLSLALGPAEAQPRRTRQFSAGESLIWCELVFRSEAGEQTCCWIVPQKEFMELFHEAGKDPSQVEEKSRAKQLEALVNDLPVPFAVVLGTVRLPLTHLAKLEPGDVLILNQRVSEPLRASIAGSEKFRVWPGRVGSRQAVQVDSMPKE